MFPYDQPHGKDYTYGRRKKKAMLLTLKYIENGQIERKHICQSCGKKKKIEIHHEDYDNPKDVLFLCKNCHASANAKRYFGIRRQWLEIIKHLFDIGEIEAHELKRYRKIKNRYLKIFYRRHRKGVNYIDHLSTVKYR